MVFFSFFFFSMRERKVFNARKKKFPTLKIQGQDIRILTSVFQIEGSFMTTTFLFILYVRSAFFVYFSVRLWKSMLVKRTRDSKWAYRNRRPPVSRLWNRSKLNDKQALCARGIAYKQERDLWDPFSNKRISYGVARRNVFQVHASCAIDAFRDAYKLQIARSGIVKSDVMNLFCRWSSSGKRSLLGELE